MYGPLALRYYEVILRLRLIRYLGPVQTPNFSWTEPNSN